MLCQLSCLGVKCGHNINFRCLETLKILYLDIRKMMSASNFRDDTMSKFMIYIGHSTVVTLIVCDRLGQQETIVKFG